MARQNPWGRRGAEWRDLLWAAAGATGVVLILALAVAVVWFIGRAPAPAPAVSLAVPSTPTPRALMFGNNTPTPRAATRDVAAAAESVATPQRLTPSAGEASGTATSGPLFAASSGPEFSRVVSGEWAVNGELLVNDGANPVAEPWLPLASLPLTSFAVEAEVRVTSLLSTVCDQSFGLAAGEPDAAVYGAGLLFPCDNGAPLARLTDISVWEDGYNADSLFAEKPFDPGKTWHTYRFEVRDKRIRLIIDGVGVVAGDVPTALDATAGKSEAGIWSQGASVEVRRVTIYPLPAR